MSKIIGALLPKLFGGKSILSRLALFSAGALVLGAVIAPTDTDSNIDITADTPVQEIVIQEPPETTENNEVAIHDTSDMEVLGLADIPAETTTQSQATQQPALSVSSPTIVQPPENNPATPQPEPITTTPQPITEPVVTSPEPSAEPLPVAVTNTDSTNTNCDPNYSPCVPYLGENALNCPDINFSVTVTGRDHNRFDGDGDGTGCERN